jgi:Domain of unknown function (DUF1707)
MNAAQETHRLPQMKASDADRDAVVATLSEHFQAGRLTTEELEERTGRALTARTLDQLGELTADLPDARPAGTGAPADLPRRPGHPAMLAVVPLAVLAAVALVVGTSVGQHAWGGLWWVIPVALLIVRRLAGPRRRWRDPSQH